MDGFARRSWLNALRENKVTDTAKESSHGNASLGSREKIRATDTDTHTAMELHQWAAVKSPLGTQTVLGDRHDPNYENLFTSAVGRLRNSPERTFQRLGTQTDELGI